MASGFSFNHHHISALDASWISFANLGIMQKYAREWPALIEGGYVKGAQLEPQFLPESRRSRMTIMPSSGELARLVCKQRR